MRRGAIDAHLCDVAFAGAASACAKAASRRDRAKAIFLRCPPHRHAKDFPCVVQFRPNALNAHLRSIVHCNFYAPRRAEEAGKLHR